MLEPFSLIDLSADPATEFTVEQDGAVIRRSILPGGIRVLTEHIPAVRSVAVGVWVAAGSRDERPEHAGSTHFLEHLLFKGTPHRSAYDISAAFDAVGGDANAATAKNYTCYYARVLDVDFPLAAEVLLDMVTSSRLTRADFDLERGVILEELAMSADDPTDVVHEAFTEAIFGTHPLGRPIGGTPDIIRALPHESVLEHYRHTYVPSEIVVTAAGNMQHEDVVAAVLAGATRGGWDLDEAVAPAPRRVAGDVTYATPTARHLDRSNEQAHAILGWPAFANSDERRFTLAVASTLLGGGMSSRLFQEIREKRGLAYTTYSYAHHYAEGGLFGLYAASSPRHMDDVVELMRAEAERLANEPVGGEELARAIGQIRGSFILSSEDPSSRMSRLGMAEIVSGTLRSFDETLSNYASVTPEEIQDVMGTLLVRNPTVVSVGPRAF